MSKSLRRELDDLKAKHNERDVLLLVVFTYIVTVGVLLNHKRIKDNEAIAEARYNLPH